MKPREAYHRRVNHFRTSLLTIQIIVMLLGGSIFTLAVICRPILRITKSDYIPTVKWIVNVMVSASVFQIVAAAYDIFSGCWKLIWPIYLGIAGTSLTVLLELTAIASSLYLYTRSLTMVNEDVVHPWYWVECLKFTNCHERMVGYINFYILPQVVLACITVVLQCATIVILARFVRAIAARMKALQEHQEKYRDELEEKKFSEAWKGNGIEEEPSTSNAGARNNNNAEEEDEDADGGLRTPKRVQFLDDLEGQLGSARKRAAAGSGNRNESIQMAQLNPSGHSYRAQIHVEVTQTPCSPCSIVTEDHGYIQGSRVSLDMDNP